MAYRIASDDPDRIEERGAHRSSWRLPARVGVCRTDCHPIEDGLSLLYTRYAPAVDLIEETRLSHPRRILMLTLGLDGESGLESANGMSLRFRAGQATLASFQSNQGERIYEAGRSVAQIRLAIDESVLARYVEAACRETLLGGSGPRLIAAGRHSAAAIGHARALLRGVAAGDGSDRLGLHIHALSLMAEALRPFETHAPGEPRLRDDDFARIERARRLMEAHLERPLTVAWLARSVGLNESKLKLGFRRYFDTTPHRLLFELRMHKARALLDQTDCQVAQAAWQVGYEHPSNFSAAFTRFFGYTPKSIAGKLRRSPRR